MSFLTHFSQFEDPRTHINKKHDLLDILFLTVSAILSGAEGWKGIHQFGTIKLDWLRQFRAFENGIPVDDTIARVISALNPEEFVHCFINWSNEVRASLGQEQIAIDGKTLRRSFNGERKTALHMVNVYSRERGLVLTQAKSESKKNENKTVLEVIKLLELKSSLITVDAMNSQKEIARQIVHQKGDYLFCIKNNHKKLREEIVAYFHKIRREKMTLRAEWEYSEVDSGHGRIETRTSTHVPISGWLTETDGWANAQSVIEISRERHKGDRIERETQYYLSSLKPNAQKAAEAIRGHWEIENKVHWVLDVTFKEDESRIRREHGPENIGALRRFVMNLARISPIKDSMKSKLQRAGWSDEIRASLLFG